MRSQWRLMHLEQRLAPAVIQWDGGPTGNGTDWLDPSNWLGDVVPSSADFVEIQSTGSNPTIALAGTASALSVNCQRAVSMQPNSSLTLGAAGSYFATLLMDGGTLDFQNGAELSGTKIDGTSPFIVPANRQISLLGCVSNVLIQVHGQMSMREDLTANAGIMISTTGQLILMGDSAPTLLTVAGELTNHGQLELSSVDQSQAAQIKLTNGTLTNSITGTIISKVGAGGVRDIQLASATSKFDNAGAWNVQTDTTISRLGAGQTVTSSGNTNIDPSCTLTVNAPLTLTGGTLSGGGQLVANTLQFDANMTTALASVTLSGSTGTGTWTIPASTIVNTNNNTNLQNPINNFGSLIIRGSSSIGAGYVSQPNSLIRIQGAPGFGTAVLHTTASFTNEGTMELTSVTSTNSAALIVDSGTFLNDSTGAIKVLNGAGGTRTLSVMFAGSLNNAGTIALVDANLTWASQPLSNAGTLSIAANCTLSTSTTVSNAATGMITGNGTLKSAGLSNSGTIAPGLPTGVLTTSSSVDHSGSLSIELNGVGLFDQWHVIGQVALTGGLQVHVNYAAQVGDEFLVIDNDGSDSISGNFTALDDGDTITVNGTTLEVDYQGGTGNDVTLKIVAIGPPPSSATMVVNTGTAQRSLVTALLVTFSEPMNFPDGLPAAFQLQRLNSGGPPDAVNLAFAGSGTSFTITFDDPVFAPDATKSLVDGVYNLKLAAAKIQGPSGPFHGGMDVDYSLHRLFGDADGDRKVNTLDFASFRSVFGTGGSIFDANNDGATNASDFAQFRARFGVTL